MVSPQSTDITGLSGKKQIDQTMSSLFGLRFSRIRLLLVCVFRYKTVKIVKIVTIDEFFAKFNPFHGIAVLIERWTPEADSAEVRYD